MDKKKKWSSPQAIIVIAIILLIFTYIGIDVAKTKPAIKSDIHLMKTEYQELTEFLDVKIPEFDSTLKIQAQQISQQNDDISSLNASVSILASDPEEPTTSWTPSE